MKIWVTKYWNTLGIYPEESDDKYGSGQSTYYYVGEVGRVKQQLKRGRDAFEQLPDAVKYCNAQLIKKVERTQKELRRLEKMVFTTKRLKG